MEESTSKSNSLIIILVVAVLLVVGGYMLMKNRNTASVQTEPSTTVNTTNTTNVASQTIEVEASEFKFTELPVLKAGQKVTLVLKNVGKMPHDFVIDEIEGATTEVIQGGQTITIEFTPTTAGTFTYYCSVGSHRAQGMEGTVTVQ